MELSCNINRVATRGGAGGGLVAPEKPVHYATRKYMTIISVSYRISLKLYLDTSHMHMSQALISTSHTCMREADEPSSDRQHFLVS